MRGSIWGQLVKKKRAQRICWTHTNFAAHTKNVLRNGWLQRKKRSSVGEGRLGWLLFCFPFTCSHKLKSRLLKKLNVGRRERKKKKKLIFVVELGSSSHADTAAHCSVCVFLVIRSSKLEPYICTAYIRTYRLERARAKKNYNYYWNRRKNPRVHCVIKYACRLFG